MDQSCCWSQQLSGLIPGWHCSREISLLLAITQRAGWNIQTVAHYWDLARWAPWANNRHHRSLSLWHSVTLQFTSAPLFLAKMAWATTERPFLDGRWQKYPSGGLWTEFKHTVSFPMYPSRVSNPYTYSCVSWRMVCYKIGLMIKISSFSLFH